MADYASESGHWYLPDGSPYYTLIGKNGNERAVTIRDARAVGALRSVTGIIDAAAKPGLINWIVEQNILAALTLPRINGESNEALLARIRADAKEQAKKARDVGTEIHGAIERFLCDLPFDRAYWPHINTAIDQINLICGEVLPFSDPEKAFAHSLGYGGKVDLHSKLKRWVIDFKGIEWKPDKPPTLWDEHYQQLAAYRRGLQMPDARCAIVFISRNQPVQSILLEADEPGLQRGLAMFDALLAYVHARDGYDPIAREYRK